MVAQEHSKPELGFSVDTPPAPAPSTTPRNPSPSPTPSPSSSASSTPTPPSPDPPHPLPHLSDTIDSFTPKRFPDRPRPHIQPGTVLRVLTATQNTSAIVFSVFMGVHVAGPVLAAFGGLSIADKVLLLGRAYYLPSEALTIYLPLTLHLLSGLLKRLYYLYKTRKPPKTAHIITGWILPFLLLPHIYSHRLIPASPHAPISALSPSELGYDFVGWGVRRWPIWSAVSYTALLGVGVWHATVGGMKVVSWLRGRRSVPVVEGADLVKGSSEDVERGAERSAEGKSVRRNGDGTIISKKRKLGLKGIMLVFLGVVGVGLVRIARDSRGVGRVMAERYEAVYRVWGL